MVSRPRSFRSLKEFTSALPHPDEAHKLFHELLDDPNDRASGITGAAYLESALEDTLTFKLKKIGTRDDLSELFRGDAPLGTFSAKIKFAYAIGLFGDRTRHNFDCVREIRNAFAHSKLKATYLTPEIVNVMLRIDFPNWAGGHPEHKDDPRMIRERYLASIVLYTEMLEETTKRYNSWTRKMLAR
ncbi:MAG: hypothetical protein ACLPKB_00685 [Xanthobacteraceae bacterium]